MVLYASDGFEIQTSAKTTANNNRITMSTAQDLNATCDIVLADSVEDVKARVHKRYVSFTGNDSAAVNILTLQQPAAATNIYARTVFVSNATGSGNGNLQEAVFLLSNPGGGNWTTAVAQDAAPGNHIISADLAVGDGTTAWSSGAATTVLSYNTNGHAGECTGYVELIYCNSGN